MIPGWASYALALALVAAPKEDEGGKGWRYSLTLTLLNRQFTLCFGRQ